MDEKILAECQIFLKKLDNAYAARDTERVADLFFDFYIVNSFCENRCLLRGSKKDRFVISKRCNEIIYHVYADCVEKLVVEPEKA